MENCTSEPVCSSLGAASCGGVLRSATTSNLSRVTTYYDSVWGHAASVYRRRSSALQLQARLAAALSSKAAAARVQSSIRQMWDLGEVGWESSDEEESPSSTALDEEGGALTDTLGLQLMLERRHARRVIFDAQQCTLNVHASQKDDEQCTDGAQQGTADSREDPDSGAHELVSTNVSVTLKRRNVIDGGSPFGVNLLGGVRDSSGEFQAYVTSVDPHHHHQEDGFGINEGDIVSFWNETKVTGMSFEQVCKLQMGEDGQNQCDETEAVVEVARCVESRQTYQTIRSTVETELAKATDSLMTPSLSNLKKEWIEQPGSIQVSIKFDPTSSSLTLGVSQTKLLTDSQSWSKQDAPKILVNVHLIPAPVSSECHRSTRLVQATPTGDAVWNQTFPPYELQKHQLMETDFQLLVWEYTHETEHKFLGEVNLLLSDSTLVDLRGHPVWYPLGEHNPNLGELPLPRLGKQKRGAVFHKLQTHLKHSIRRRSSENLVDTRGDSSDVRPPSNESTLQRHRKKSHHSASIPCIVEELTGNQAPSHVGVMSQSEDGDPHHLSVFGDRVGSTWNGFLDSCSTLEEDASETASLSTSQRGLRYSDCLSDQDSVFVDSEEELTDAPDSTYSPATLGGEGLEEFRGAGLLPHRYRKFASTSNLVACIEDEGDKQCLSSHRWSRSLSDLREEVVAYEAPPSETSGRKKRTGLLARMWRRLSSRQDEANDSRGHESLSQLGPAQFVPEGCKLKNKQLSVVGRVELLLQWAGTAMLKITFNQLTKTSQRSLHGDCLTRIATYDDGEKLVSKRQVSLHFQAKSKSTSIAFVSTKQSSSIQLSMRYSSGRLSKPISGEIWLNIAELTAHDTTPQAGVSGWFLLHKP